MIAIVDYGAGNLASVEKAFRHIGAKVVVTSRPEVVAEAYRVVLPGVGNFAALSALDQHGLTSTLLAGLKANKPFLGICLGMQWLFRGSAEAQELQGAGIFPGRCELFPNTVKSPHVGWNSLSIATTSNLFRGVARDPFVYFTHSFHAPVVDATTARTDHGIGFSAAVEQGNVFGVQFHPEKSGEVGLTILRNFCEMCPC